MPDPTATHRAELDAFLAEHDYGIPFEVHCDRHATVLVITSDTPRMHVRGWGAALQLPLHEAHDGAACWSAEYVVVPLPTTTLRITTPMIPTQRTEPRDFPRSVAS